MHDNKGFTIIEMLIVIVIIGLMAAVVVPNLLGYLPESRLKTAGRDLFSNMQRAKISAIKNNTNWAIVFNVGAGVSGQYYVCSSDGGDGIWTGPGGNDIVERTVDLDNTYGSGVTYGSGTATAPNPLDVTFDNGVTYPLDVAVFQPRGTTQSNGTVFLTNNNNRSCIGVGTTSAGVIRLRRWTGSSWTD